MKNVNERKVNHFSIRKLSIGAASVLLSTTVYFGLKLQEPTVHAAEVTSEETNQESNSTIAVNSDKVSSDKETTKNIDAGESSKNVSTKTDSTQQNLAQDPTVATNPTAEVIYPNKEDNVQAGNWFKVKVSSGDLTDVKKGSLYQVTVGNSLPIDYDRSEFSTPDFDVANMGNGTYNLTATNDYSNASFDIVVSMSYKGNLATDKTISLPITFNHDDQTKTFLTNVNLVPAPKPTYEETHPLLKYVCYGLNPLTNTISWGIYVNYNATDLRDVDIEGTFSGAQELIKKSILVYDTFPGDSGDLNVTEHQYQQYNYSLSKLMQDESTPKSIELKQAGPFVVDNIDYSKKPLYIYFQTQLNDSNNPTPGSDKPTNYASELSLNAAGISIKQSEAPAPTGNSGTSTGENSLVPVSESKTITETINYLYADTNKIAAPQYKAEPLTFTRTGKKNTVTGEIMWNAWTPAQTFKSVVSPIIEGYTVDKEKIEAQTVNFNSKDLVFNVYYAKTEVPVIPEQPVTPTPIPDPEPIPQPHPNEPSEPVTPTTPSEPNTEVEDVPMPHATNNDEITRSSSNNSKIAKRSMTKPLSLQKAVAPKANELGENTGEQTKLPQTNSKKNSLEIVGIGISALIGALSLFGFNKKKN